jgi:hypothetical protein
MLMEVSAFTEIEPAFPAPDVEASIAPPSDRTMVPASIWTFPALVSGKFATLPSTAMALTIPPVAQGQSFCGEM